MKNKLITATLLLAGTLALNSCLIYQGVQAFVREDYPGTRPPKVIKDVNGKPASQAWKSLPADMLPPASYLKERVTYAPDGTPYGLTSEYSNITISPHYPYRELDYTGFAPGDKVWDPYTRKAFYIKRAYTFN